MKLSLLIDMNLSPDWVDTLDSYGIDSVHWSAIGSPTAPDTEIMEWARLNHHVVFTHDLDFGALLAQTHQAGPSVIQIRTRSILPTRAATLLIQALSQHEADLESGALIVVDEIRSRVRILPI